MNPREELTEKENALRKLLASQQTLLLSTASLTGTPEMSYAPFVMGEAGCFHVLISELATHTGHLQNNPKASLMIIRPEHESDNLFARERAIFQCTATEIHRDDERYTIVLAAMQNQFGNIVTVLGGLADFHLFALSPESGRYVAGFGQAYTLDTQAGTLSFLIKKHRQ